MLPSHPEVQRAMVANLSLGPGEGDVNKPRELGNEKRRERKRKTSTPLKTTLEDGVFCEQAQTLTDFSSITLNSDRSSFEVLLRVQMERPLVAGTSTAAGSAAC